MNSIKDFNASLGEEVPWVSMINPHWVELLPAEEESQEIPRIIANCAVPKCSVAPGRGGARQVVLVQHETGKSLSPLPLSQMAPGFSSGITHSGSVAEAPW